jgi:phosphoribosylpyrophosphate synthetase
MIDTAGTLAKAAEELKKRGAKRVFAFATHGTLGLVCQVYHGDSLFTNVESINRCVLRSSI